MVMVKDRLRMLRDERGLSQSALAEVLGVPQQTISDMETGRRRYLRAEDLIKFGEYYAVDYNWLLMGRGNAQSRE